MVYPARCPPATSFVVNGADGGFTNGTAPCLVILNGPSLRLESRSHCPRYSLDGGEGQHWMKSRCWVPVPSRGCDGETFRSSLSTLARVLTISQRGLVGGWLGLLL